MDKRSLRLKYKDLREKLSDDEIDNLSLDIANQALKLPIWQKINYHLFLSIVNKKELDTTYLLQILAGKDKNVILSKSDFLTNSMINYLLTDNTVLRVNSYGIPEPEGGFVVADDQIDVVFVPLLAFDVNGNRVGYGKGFYDKFLSQCKKDVVKVGLSFFEAEEKILGILDTDIRLDYCVTPNKIYEFNKFKK